MTLPLLPRTTISASPLIRQSTLRLRASSVHANRRVGTACGIIGTRHHFASCFHSCSVKGSKKACCVMSQRSTASSASLCLVTPYLRDVWHVQASGKQRWSSPMKQKQGRKKAEGISFFPSCFHLWDIGGEMHCTLGNGMIRLECMLVWIHLCTHRHTHTVQEDLRREATEHQTAHPTDAWLTPIPLCLPGSLCVSVYAHILFWKTASVSVWA